MTQKLHLETGHPARGDAKQIEGNEIRIVNQDGRCLFEVRICKDQASIEVRAVDTHKVGDVIHDGLLIIQPKASNNIVVSTPAY